MHPKRPFQDYSEDGTGVPTQEAKRLNKDVLGMLSMSEFVSRMESFLQSVVRDEVEKTVARILRSSLSRPLYNQAQTSGARGFLLRFVNKLPATIFTGGRIEAEDGNPVRIELLDANTRTIVTAGALSSMKIEIVVLGADFGSDEQQDWTENEFTASIIREREGRRPLLTGEGLIVTLSNGIGLIGDVVFTDNSSWQRSRKFRLGAKPVQKVPTEVKIQEARSEAFVVKDHRGELYKKHYPPHLDDETWRLEKIAKDGAFHTRLASNGILTVKDFLRSYMSNPVPLQKILEISSRQWDTIINHAISCVLNDDEYYMYYNSTQGVKLLFNCIHQVVKVAFDGQNYLSLHELAPFQKVLVESCKQQAYKNVKDFIRVDARSIFALPMPLATLQAEPFNSTPNHAPQQLQFPVMHQDVVPEMQIDFKNSSGSTFYTNDVNSSSQIEVSVLENGQTIQPFTPILKNSFKLSDNIFAPYPGDTNWSLQWPIETSTVEDISHVDTSTWTQGNALIFASDNQGELGVFSSLPSVNVGRPKAGWCKLRAAFKFRSIKRDVTARRLARLFYVGY